MSWRSENGWMPLLDLLDVTADALAATWDQRSEVSPGEEAFKSEEDFKPTIH